MKTGSKKIPPNLSRFILIRKLSSVLSNLVTARLRLNRTSKATAPTPSAKTKESFYEPGWVSTKFSLAANTSLAKKSEPGQKLNTKFFCSPDVSMVKVPRSEEHTSELQSQ